MDLFGYTVLVLAWALTVICIGAAVYSFLPGNIAGIVMAFICLFGVYHCGSFAIQLTKDARRWCRGFRSHPRMKGEQQ